MLAAAQHVVRSLDSALAAAYLSLFRERDGLLCFLFHSLFVDEAQVARGDVDPLDRTTVAHFRALVEYFLAHGYRFVAPEGVLAGLPAGGKYAMVTFDDGYYNNTLALPVLDKLKVPATFFISADHVRLGKCFWWDVLYRERRARGASERDVWLESQRLKRLPTERIEDELKSQFGERALTPRGDIDRPFTPAELNRFATHPRVRIGNHTANHAILTNYAERDARDQVVRAQEWLAEVAGAAPTAIAYPNGDHDERVLRVSREAGLKLGFTVRPQKTPVPVGEAPEALLRIGRYTPYANGSLAAQCGRYRSDFQLYGTFRSAYLKLRRRATR